MLFQVYAVGLEQGEGVGDAGDGGGELVGGLVGDDVAVGDPLVVAGGEGAGDGADGFLMGVGTDGLLVDEGLVDNPSRDLIDGGGGDVSVDVGVAVGSRTG